MGYGICRYPNEDRYMGEWKDNWRHGVGTLQIAETGNRYVGDWQKDRRYGVGILYSPTNQKIYEGAWWRNLPCGKGTFWHFDGTVYEGEIVNFLVRAHSLYHFYFPLLRKTALGRRSG